MKEKSVYLAHRYIFFWAVMMGLGCYVSDSLIRKPGQWSWLYAAAFIFTVYYGLFSYQLLKIKGLLGVLSSALAYYVFLPKAISSLSINNSTSFWIFITLDILFAAIGCSMILKYYSECEIA